MFTEQNLVECAELIPSEQPEGFDFSKWRDNAELELKYNEESVRCEACRCGVDQEERTCSCKSKIFFYMVELG